MNTQQSEFVTRDVCNMSLKGIPGGGKTKSIIDKILYLYQSGYIKKNNNFLILTFTKNAKKDFKLKGQVKNKKLFTDHNVKTIHSLSMLMMNSLMDNGSRNLSTVVASLLYNLTNDTSMDVCKISCLKECKVIFVDEAQDISEVQYKTIQLIASKINCNVIMVGDPNQNIYQFQGGSDKYLTEHSDTNIQLIYNYRSTKSIVNFLNHFRPWKEESEPMESVGDKEGIKPIIYSGELDYLIRKLMKELRDTPVPYEDIAIIGPVKKGKYNPAGCPLNIGLQIFAEYFEKYKIPYVSHYVIPSTDNKSKVKEKKVGHINLYTIHGSKGLEFKKVFILNFHFSTMGRIPNQKSYNEYKYLWYTALSRAKDELSILIDHKKTPWLGLQDCPTDLYRIKYENKTKGPIEFHDRLKKTTISDEDDIIERIAVTEILDHRLFGEDKQYELELMVGTNVTEETIFEKATSEIVDISEFSALYGQYMEDIFTYYYLSERSNNDMCDPNDHYRDKGSNDLKNYINSFVRRNNHNIVVPISLRDTFVKLKHRFGEITLNTLRQNIIELDDDGRRIIKHLESISNIQGDQSINQKTNNGVSSFDQDYFMKHWLNISKGKNVPESLFYLSLYFYQIEHECMSLLTRDYSSHLISLKPYLLRIIKYAKSSPDGYEFQVRNEHPNLPSYGYADIKHDSKIIDIKFTQGFNQSYIYQLLFYYNNIFPKWSGIPELEVINLFTGIKTTIHIKESLTNRDLNYFLCETFSIKMKKNIIVYDLETTGLDTNSCEIIERYMYDMTLDNVLSEGLVCPRQEIPPEIEGLTGITNELMMELGETLFSFKNEMRDRLKYYDMPTFIAHNGNSFDHKILKRLKIIPVDSNLLDSKIIMNNRSKDKLYDMKLINIYEKVKGPFPPENAHRAEADTIMIIDIFKQLNITCKHIQDIVVTIEMNEC